MSNETETLLYSIRIFAFVSVLAMVVPAFIVYLEYLYKKQDKEEDVDI